MNPQTSNYLAKIEDLRWFNEALLLRQLGYVLFTEYKGLEYPVSDIRQCEGEPNLEVLTIQGWSRPSKCWAVLGKPKPSEQAVEQPGLFG